MGVRTVSFDSKDCCECTRFIFCTRYLGTTCTHGVLRKVPTNKVGIMSHALFLFLSRPHKKYAQKNFVSEKRYTKLCALSRSFSRGRRRGLCAARPRCFARSSKRERGVLGQTPKCRRRRRAVYRFDRTPRVFDDAPNQSPPEEARDTKKARKR